MSAEAINQLYIETYGRPASEAEIDYHSKRFGAELDEIESQFLQKEITSAPGYTPPEKTADAGVDGTPPSQPPEAPAEAPQLGIYMRESLPSTRSMPLEKTTASRPRISGLDYYRNTFFDPFEFRGLVDRQNVDFNPYSQNYMNQYQRNRMNRYKAPVMVTPTEEDRKKYFSKDKPQLFSSGEQFFKNTQPFNPYSQQQLSPMGGGKGGRPSGTIGMGAAPAGIGGKR